MIPTDLEIEECSVSRSREPKKKPTRLRSIKLSRLPSLKTSMKQAKSDGSPNYIEASSCNSETGFDLNDKNRKCLIRKSSMKPVRILTKTVSLRRKKRPSIRRASVDSSGSPVDKPTCSSTLKGSKFSDDVEIQATANGVAVKKVCPYTYCSLHGHKKHEPSPPLKRFLSTRRQQLIKSQKGTKPENQNQSHQTQRAKQSGNKKKGGLNSQTVKNGGLDVEKSKEVISRGGDDENVAEFVLGETSYPLIDSMENLEIDLKEDIAVSNLDNAHNDDSEEDDLTGVAGEPSVGSASVNNSLRELPVAIEDGERVSDTQSSRDEESQETNTQLEKQNSQMVNNGDLDVEETGYAGAEAESKEVTSSAGDDESVAEVVLGETSYPLMDSMENLQIDLKEEDNSHNTVFNLDNAHNENSEDDLTGEAGEPSITSANNSLQELPVIIEDGERVSDTQSSRDEETNTQLEKQNSQTVNNGDLGVEETGYSGAEADSTEVISSVGDDENVAEVVLGETSYPLVDSMENLQIDLKEEDIVVSNLDNAHNDDLEADDLIGVAGEPTVASAPASVNNSLPELPIAIEDGKRVSDGQSSDEETNTQLEKQNYSSLWNLIYRRMTSDIAATDGDLDKVNKGENVEADDMFLQVESNDSDQGYSKAGGVECEEDHESGNQEIELNQTDAIKLVQEAINRILLQETPQLSSDEVSVTSEMISDQELNEQHHGEDKEMGIASSRALGEDKFGEFDCKILADQKVLLKSKLMASKRWSNLKKVILLKRFVKALERTKKFNPRKPQYLPVEPDPEAEKVSLRRQTTEERKNTDEWMLDYALRQVISKLAPAQKKRVALLVNAFETVIPPAQTAETPRFRVNLGTPSSVNPAEVCTEKENNGGNLADKLQSQVAFPEIKERTSGDRIEAEPA